MDTTPQTKSNYLTYSLDQLRELRAGWLVQSVLAAPVLKKVVTTLGQPQNDPTGRMPNTFQGIAGNGWQAYYWEIDDARDVKHNRWHTHGRLWIEAGNHTPVRLEYEDGNLCTQPGSVYIPGRWVDELLAMESRANQVIETRVDLGDMSERESLIAELCIGVLI
jgi:hypothetical protein